jgi:polysaccharide export outer membrane protein
VTAAAAVLAVGLVVGAARDARPDEPILASPISVQRPAQPGAIGAVQDAGRPSFPRDAWEARRLAHWQQYAQGEYVAHDRTAHVPEYRLRVDDQLDLIYRVTRDVSSRPYTFQVGDEIRLESFVDPNLDSNLTILPDGTITPRLLGPVPAAGRTQVQLRDQIEKLYEKYYKVPSITILALKVNTRLEDLRATVDRRQGLGGQTQLVRVTPEGTISLPAIGSVNAQGLTLRELQAELNERYRAEAEGMEVVPVLALRAPRFLYVLGEVRLPGRFEMVGPTTVIQAISLAGGWNVGANLKQVVVFRRGDDWRLTATMLDLCAPLYARQLCPPNEIWMSDSDIVIVPKGRILQVDEFINLVFTRGIYGVLPMQGVAINFAKASTL